MSEAMSARPRIAIMAETGARVFNWSRTRTVIEESGAEIHYLVEQPLNWPNRKLAVLPARLAWRILRRFENRRLAIADEHFHPDDPIPLPCTFKGHFKHFSAEALERIATAEFDLIIRLGGRGIYTGPILTLPRCGLVSIHHGDNRRYRGGPPGFWEAMNGENELGFIVQRLTATLDGGEVLARGQVPAGRTAAENCARLYAAADAALADAMRHFLATGRLPQAEPAAERLGPIYKLPGLKDLAAYLFRERIPVAERPLRA